MKYCPIADIAWKKAETNVAYKVASSRISYALSYASILVHGTRTNMNHTQREILMLNM